MSLKVKQKNFLQKKHKEIIIGYNKQNDYNKLNIYIKLTYCNIFQSHYAITLIKYSLYTYLNYMYSHHDYSLKA